MNKALQRFLLPVSALLMAGMLVVTGCGKIENLSTPAGVVTAAAPIITSLSPSSGGVGTPVRIDGFNFSTTASNNVVKFNGIQAVIISSNVATITGSANTTGNLTVAVPAGAVTGPVTVAVAGQTATSSYNFNITEAAPFITGFTPTSGAVGTTVTITGINFSTTAAKNTVKFNGTTATVSTATATSLTVTVPTGATTGTISVTTAGGTATSSYNFNITDSASTAGISWTQQTVGTNYLNNIAWSGTLFAVVGANGTILTSPDGYAWSARNSGVTDTLEGITWSTSLSKFIVVGHGQWGRPTILTSSDGVTWTKQTVSAGSNVWTLRNVTCSSNLCVAVGISGAILTSTDGTTWITRSSGTQNEISNVVWGGSKFVAIGGSNGAVGFTSSDGITWTQQPAIPYSGMLFGLAWSGSRFVMTGWGGTILSSSDGVSWTSQTSGTTNGLWGVTWSGNQFVAVGGNGTILTSPDGLTWTSRTSGTTAILNSVVWSQPLSRFVVTGGTSASGTTLTSAGSFTVNTAPNAPTGVTATAGNGQIIISWSAVSGATSYNIYYATTTGVTKTTGTKVANATSPYRLTGLNNGTTYYYIVAAENANGESTGSAELNATPQIASATVTSLATALSSPQNIAVDSTSVYWTELTGDSVKKVDINGGVVTVLASGLSGPREIAVDSTSVYWTEWTSGSDPGRIQKVSKNGGAVTTLSSGLGWPKGIAVNPTDVYWASYGSNGNTINKIGINGGTATTVASNLNGPYYLAADAGYVYWIERSAGVVKKVSKNGGAIATLASGLNYPEIIILDSTNVYWTEWTSGSDPGTVKKVNKNGGTATTLVAGVSSPVGIAVDSANVYWTEYFGGTVKKVSLNGGPITTLISGQSYPSGIAVDSINVYFTEDTGRGTIKKMSK